MLRKRISRWSSKSEGDSSSALSEAFWQYFADSLSKSVPNGYSDNSPVNSKKYSSSSSVVVQLKALFGPELPQPSLNQLIASLKSPFTQGDVTRAFHLIRYFQLCDNGYFITNEGSDRAGANIQLLGAENWEHVMCYMDALLFSMFANLESFEPILFVSNQASSPLVSQLSCLLRVYVSLMRSGNLITTDLTQRICDCLFKLGFQEALSHKQQDCAPLFEFLTETLSMPLLTFKVEIQHSGKHDDDDTKYSKERILFVSVPGSDEDLPETSDGSEPEAIPLEDCLEHYFNNSISVKRELQRRATLESVTERPNITANDIDLSDEKAPVNSVMVRTSSQVQTPKRTSTNSAPPTQPPSRHRSSTLSVWSIASVDSKSHEVMLPAWMLLRLLPFYTDDNKVTKDNESIARNSHEFADRRPVLPICLKRYSFSSSKKHSRRMKKKIIIPPVIELPQFVADDRTKEISGSNFRLILESAVCHRGTSIESGHFVSAVRKSSHLDDESLDDSHDAPWYLYDDMKSSKVVTKTFTEIFDTEWPYMLFYRLTTTGSAKSGLGLNVPGMSPVTRPQGTRAKYWDENSPTPMQSSTEDLVVADMTESISVLKVKEAELQETSVPIPDVPPTDAKFVDIRKRYLWYVTDKEKNYYKESASISKTGSISITPQFRRNSQWSDVSNISGLALEEEPIPAARNGSVALKSIHEKHENHVPEKVSSPKLTASTPHPVKSRNSFHKSRALQKVCSPETGHSSRKHAKKIRHHDPKKEKCVII